MLLLIPGLAQADWTGVSLELANLDSDWKFDSEVREAQISSISFQMEEKAANGLSVGFGIGYFSLRVKADTPVNTRKFDGQHLKIYLRQSFAVSKNIELFGSLSYRYNSGSGEGIDDDDADIDWNETSFQLGASARIANVKITPFVAYYDIDGDISDDNGTNVFELDDPVSQGIRFDYFLEETAFVRFEILSGGRSGGFLSFLRRY